MIIFVGGRKGSGKDTFSDYLVDKYGFNKRAFADPIRTEYKDMFELNSDDEYNKLKRSIIPINISGDIRHVSGRDILVKLGQLMRSYNENQFVEYVESEIENNPDKNWVISDTRMDNEYELYQKLKLTHSDVYFIKIDRKHFDSVHHEKMVSESEVSITERGFPDSYFDMIFVNDYVTKDFFLQYVDGSQLVKKIKKLLDVK